MPARRPLHPHSAPPTGAPGYPSEACLPPALDTLALRVSKQPTCSSLAQMLRLGPSLWPPQSDALLPRACGAAAQHAKARGAKIYCELAGFAATCDAHHITTPHPEGQGLSECLRLAIARRLVARARCPV